MLDLKEILNIMEPIVREAGLTALSLQENLESIQFKSAKDIVTSADLACEKIIVDGILKHFKEHDICTEERGNIIHENKKSDYLWVLDPIDGTVNFSRGIPLWGISLALLYKKQVVLSICFLPRLSEMFIALRGVGSYLNGKKIAVSNTSSLERFVVSNGDFNVGNPEKINAQNSENLKKEAVSCMRVKCMGSAVAEGCFLACGRLDAFIMTMSYPWDIAGISLLIEEAGGKATKLNGKALEFINAEQALFTNNKLHQTFVEMCSC